MNFDECARFAFQKKPMFHALMKLAFQMLMEDYYCYSTTDGRWLYLVKSQHLHKTTTWINWIICVTLYSLNDAIYHNNAIHWFTCYFFYPPLNESTCLFVCLGIWNSMNQRFNKLASIYYWKCIHNYCTLNNLICIMYWALKSFYQFNCFSMHVALWAIVYCLNVNCPKSSI